MPSMTHSKMPPSLKKHAGGGEICMACGGMACKFAEGGPVSRMEHEKGVHSPGWGDAPSRGQSMAGGMLRSGSKPSMEKGKEEHREVLSEMKAMPKPNIKGLAHGGEVMEEEHEEMPMDEDGEMKDMIGQEAMKAIHSKDHKGLMHCIEAAVLHCMNKKGE